ncbi:MAG: glycosyltransferase family 39 protein [Candidatus Eremiobacteraeota bacterium]|nr:glycosyltransferase family 39 protein [Candidatus Eremiobacteraeota bacterium]
MTFRELGRLIILRFPASFHPPLVYWASIPFHAIFGRGLPGLQSTTLFFIIILLLSTYGTGKRLWNEKVGLLAEFLAGTSPGVIFYFPNFLLDVPLAGMVMLSLYFLFSSGEFRNRGYSILFGISIGLGALVKNTHFLYILPAFLVSAFPGLLKSLPHKRQKFDMIILISGFVILLAISIKGLARGSPILSWGLLLILIIYLGLIPLFYSRMKDPGDSEPVHRLINICLAIGLGFLIGWSWYSANWAGCMDTYYKYALPPIADDLVKDSRGHTMLTFFGKSMVVHAGLYLQYLMKCEFLPGIFWLFLVSIIVLFIRKDGRPGRSIFWCLLLVFVLLSLSPVYGNRYLVPFVALSVLPISYFVFTLKRPTWLVILLVIIGLIQAVGWMNPFKHIISNIPGTRIITRTEFKDQLLLDIPSAWAYSRYRWRIFKPFIVKPGRYSRIKEILSVLPRDARLILALDEYGAWFFRSYAMLGGYRFSYGFPVINGKGKLFRYSDADPFTISPEIAPDKYPFVLVRDSLRYDPESGVIDYISGPYKLRMRVRAGLKEVLHKRLRSNLMIKLYSSGEEIQGFSESGAESIVEGR